MALWALVQGRLIRLRALPAILRRLDRTDALDHPLEMIRSTLSSGSGMASSSPSNGSTLDMPASDAAFAVRVEHLGQEVQRDHPAGRAGAVRGQDGIDATAASQIEHGVAGPDGGVPQVVGYPSAGRLSTVEPTPAPRRCTGCAPTAALVGGTWR